MGAIRTCLAIRRTRPDARSPSELHRALWDKVDYTIRCTVTGDAGTQVLAMYLGMVASDGFADGSWRSTDEQLDFTFTDAAGMCSMSSQAAAHWLDVVLWTDSMVHDVVRAAGWELVDLPRVPALVRVLHARTPALVELRGNLYAVPRRPPGARIDDDDFYSDDGIPKPSLAELAPEERVAIEAAAYAGACTCEYCRNVLPFVHLPQWGEGRIEDVAATWAALDGLAAEEEAAAAAAAAFSAEEWRRDPLGPPELGRLRDALARQGLALPIALLVPMLLQRALASGRSLPEPPREEPTPAKATKAKATKAKATKAKATKATKAKAPAKATKAKATKAKATKAKATKAKATKAKATKAKATKAKAPAKAKKTTPPTKARAKAPAKARAKAPAKARASKAERRLPGPKRGLPAERRPAP